MNITRFLSSVLLVAVTASTSIAQESKSVSELAKAAAKSRRELLRDPSDLGIGLTINRDLGDAKLSAGSGDRRASVTEYGGSLFGLRYYGYRPFDSFGYRIYGRSSLYDWQAPAVKQYGNRWIIQPGYFRESSPDALWHP